ncbi:GNAT family N-acetyltransferase [Xylophilus sp. Kf1]|nr:GNAT family N-acetyltransferase [Xylophilus sp. Kf1]
MHAFDITSLEQRGFSAWPARTTVPLDGWRCRFNDGFTKRANSVNPELPGAAVEGIRETAEALYRQQGLPCIFRLTPLAADGADRVLERAGYTRFDPSWVARIALVSAALPAAVEVSPQPTDAWLDGFADANGVRPADRAVHHRMLRSIARPCGFATLRHHDEAIGFALVVLERGAAGFYDVVVAPHRRGQGHGRSLMRGLQAWAKAQGASIGYLQVREQNTGARRLYAGLGFEDVYAYHYRMPPAVDASSMRMQSLKTEGHIA